MRLVLLFLLVSPASSLSAGKRLRAYVNKLDLMENPFEDEDESGPALVVNMTVHSASLLKVLENEASCRWEVKASFEFWNPRHCWNASLFDGIDYIVVNQTWLPDITPCLLFASLQEFWNPRHCWNASLFDGIDYIVVNQTWLPDITPCLLFASLQEFWNPRHCWNASLFDGIDYIVVNQTWLPDITPCLFIEWSRKVDGSSLIRMAQNGTVSTNFNFIVTGKCPMNFAKLPHDTHTCTPCLSISSAGKFTQTI